MDRWASGIDTAWLQLEQETNRMVVHGVLFCDGPLDLDVLRTRVRERWVDVYPGFRQRPTWPTGPLGPARWVDAPPDLSVHVTTMALSAPGDDRALARRVGELMSSPLPTDRPWWRIEAISGYDGTAVHVAIHHGLADGVALNHLFHALADPVSDPRTPAAYVEPPREARPVHDVRLFRREVRDRASSLWATVKRSGTPEGLAELGATGRAVRHSASLLASPPREKPSPLQGRPGVAKAARWTSAVPLDDVRAAGKASGGSVNDVLCGAIAGALRAFLGGSSDVPRLRAVMPTNLRPLDRPISAELGNEFGLVLPPLPTDEPDRARRVERMHRSMATIKRTNQALASFTGIAAAGLGTPAHTQQLVARYARAGSLIISNVPGPLEELSLGSVRVRDLMFWVPCSARLGLGVSVLSYAGRVRLGVDADLGLIGGEEGVDRFTAALDAELAALRTR
ncbi:wax ester/triacylglycerol synthase domain-containing protein [Actinomycetospora termitidis]|uniref:diacylglycerol O-acyltransferase n=1 Tax=Actinomycetospora termitidis TaxID=3053470 RepID=A0ABT7MCZ3_9PSEU|nr:wax ester/triacylglycerol synthase domain-containing protein [Actinomycetospora sp. Odt1-22]MDL5158543.1 wax ester/triacylglycerol synthase family O-acyltransferase [Actinomycetospora sp. Odt1-22]